LARHALGDRAVHAHGEARHAGPGARRQRGSRARAHAAHVRGGGEAAPERGAQGRSRAAQQRRRHRDGPLERGAGMALLKRVRRAVCWATLLVGVTRAAQAESFVSLDSALAQSFPGARVERRTLALSVADVKAVEKRARARSDTRLVTAYVAWRGDTLA